MRTTLANQLPRINLAAAVQARKIGLSERPPKRLAAPFEDKWQAAERWVGDGRQEGVLGHSGVRRDSHGQEIQLGESRQTGKQAHLSPPAAL
jgi:hypothetical protein